MQEQIDLFSKKIKAKPGQQSSFNAVTRNDKQIIRNYFGQSITNGPKYLPDYSLTKKNLQTGNVAIAP